MHLLASMRGSEKIVALVAVAIPLLVATLGWRTLVSLVNEPSPLPPTPQIPGATATLAATARVAPPAPRPTIGGAVRAATLTPALAATPADDPAAAVSSFYALVARHQFDAAARLWTPRMRAEFPPEANLNQRFSQTQQIQLRRVEVLSQAAGMLVIRVFCAAVKNACATATMALAASPQRCQRESCRRSSFRPPNLIKIGPSTTDEQREMIRRPTVGRQPSPDRGKQCGDPVVSPGF